MNRPTCGYHGHYCNPTSVYFISRGFNTNDYCVYGKRVSVSDDGQTSSNATVLDLHAIYGYELRKHQEYLEWRERPENDQIRQYTNPEPFDAGITRVEMVRP